MFHRQRALYVGTQNKLFFERYGVDQDKLFFMPYACDDHLPLEHKRLSGRKAELRASFGIQEDAGPVLLTVSRLIDKKQPLLLLDAFARVRSRTRCCLLIVGSGPLEPTMREVVRQRSIPDVVFAGFINQTGISRAYAASDIFILASKMHETWGMVVNEAMTFDLPVILSDKVSAAYDLVDNGRNGFMVPANSPHALASRMRELVASPSLRARFGADARRVLAGHTYYEALTRWLMRLLTRWAPSAGRARQMSRWSGPCLPSQTTRPHSDARWRQRRALTPRQLPARDPSLTHRVLDRFLAQVPRPAATDPPDGRAQYGGLLRRRPSAAPTSGRPPAAAGVKPSQEPERRCQLLSITAARAHQ